MIYLTYQNSHTRVEVSNNRTEEDNRGLLLIEKICKLEVKVFRSYKGRSKAKRKIECFNYFENSHFPSGWIHKVCKILERNSIPFKVSYNQTQWLEELNPDKKKDENNYYFQNEAIDAAVSYKRGIIWLPTGSGKTRVASEIIHGLSLTTLFLTPTIPLMYQTYDVLVKKFGKEVVGIIGDGEYNPGIVTVASIMTIYSRIEKPEVLDFLSEIGLLILDEAHKINWATRKEVLVDLKGEPLFDIEGKEKTISKTELENAYFEIVQKCDAEYRIALTATPGEEGSLQRVLLEACTGPVIYRKPAVELYEQGYISVPEVCMFLFNVDHLPETENWREKKNLLTEDFKFKTLVAKICERFVQEEKTILVSCDEIESQIKPYSAMVPNSEVLIGKASADIHKKEYRDYLLQTLDRFRKKEIKVLFSTVMREGVDIPSMDAVMIPFGGTKFNSVIQKVGRALRKFEGKNKAYIIDFYICDNSILEKWSKNRINHFTSEGYPVTIYKEPSEVFEGVKEKHEQPEAWKKQFLDICRGRT